MARISGRSLIDMTKRPSINRRRSANRDVAKLMELGGWKTLDMVMRYTHVNRDHLRGSINDMWSEAKAANRRLPS